MRTQRGPPRRRQTSAPRAGRHLPCAPACTACGWRRPPPRPPPPIAGYQAAGRTADRLAEVAQARGQRRAPGAAHRPAGRSVARWRARSARWMRRRRRTPRCPPSGVCAQRQVTASSKREQTATRTLPVAPHAAELTRPLSFLDGGRGQSPCGSRTSALRSAACTRRRRRAVASLCITRQREAASFNRSSSGRPPRPLVSSLDSGQHATSPCFGEGHQAAERRVAGHVVACACRGRHGGGGEPDLRGLPRGARRREARGGASGRRLVRGGTQRQDARPRQQSGPRPWAWPRWRSPNR